MLDDQVLGVVCPPVLAAGGLREGIESDPDAPDLPRRLAHEERVHEVTRHCFVCGGDGERWIVEAFEPLLLSLHRPGGIGVGDIVDRRDGGGFQRRRGVHGRQPDVERLGRLNNHALVVRQVDQSLADDKLLQLIHRLSGGLHQTSARRVILEHLAPDIHGVARCIDRFGPFDEEYLLACQFTHTDCQHLLGRQIDQLFGPIARLDIVPA